MLKLYDDLRSGNCYKARLLLTQLDTPFERVNVDVLKRETRTADFLAMNPNGRVPLLEFEDGSFLPESNAILWYLAEGTSFLPDTRRGRAEALRWMFFEQYSHEPYIAVARFIIEFLGKPAEQQTRLDSLRAPGYAALQTMEEHLRNHTFFAGEQYSVADISLYAYTHVADEAELDLSEYPQVRAWLRRVREQARHIPITSE